MIKIASITAAPEHESIIRQRRFENAVHMVQDSDGLTGLIFCTGHDIILLHHF
jgi:hypothetical protein